MVDFLKNYLLFGPIILISNNFTAPQSFFKLWKFYEQYLYFDAHYLRIYSCMSIQLNLRNTQSIQYHFLLNIHNN